MASESSSASASASASTVAPFAVIGEPPNVEPDLLDEILNVAMDAGRKAGGIILEHARGADVTKNKANARDLLTEIDPLCERTIQETVLSSFPDHVFLGEEDVPPGKEAAAEALQSKLEASAETWLWIVDPIDGTTNVSDSVFGTTQP